MTAPSSRPSKSSSAIATASGKEAAVLRGLHAAVDEDEVGSGRPRSDRSGAVVRARRVDEAVVRASRRLLKKSPSSAKPGPSQSRRAVTGASGRASSTRRSTESMRAAKVATRASSQLCGEGRGKPLSVRDEPAREGARLPSWSAPSRPWPRIRRSAEQERAPTARKVGMAGRTPAIRRAALERGFDTHAEAFPQDPARDHAVALERAPVVAFAAVGLGPQRAHLDGQRLERRAAASLGQRPLEREHQSRAALRIGVDEAPEAPARPIEAARFQGDEGPSIAKPSVCAERSRCERRTQPETGRKVLRGPPRARVRAHGCPASGSVRAGGLADDVARPRPRRARGPSSARPVTFGPRRGCSRRACGASCATAT